MDEPRKKLPKRRMYRRRGSNARPLAAAASSRATTTTASARWGTRERGFTSGKPTAYWPSNCEAAAVIRERQRSLLVGTDRVGGDAVRGHALVSTFRRRRSIAAICRITRLGLAADGGVALVHEHPAGAGPCRDGLDLDTLQVRLQQQGAAGRSHLNRSGSRTVVKLWSGVESGQASYLSLLLRLPHPLLGLAPDVLRTATHRRPLSFKATTFWFPFLHNNNRPAKRQRPPVLVSLRTSVDCRSEPSSTAATSLERLPNLRSPRCTVQGFEAQRAHATAAAAPPSPTQQRRER